jgi:hypothetical protein
MTMGSLLPDTPTTGVSGGDDPMIIPAGAF